MKNDSAVNLDYMQTVQQSGLKIYVGHLPDTKQRDVGKALGIALGCL